MKKTILKLTLACSAAAIMSGAALAQTPITLVNPGFELPGTVKIPTGFDTAGNDVPGWMNTGGAYTDTGVQGGGHSGSWEGYTQTGEGGAYQISGYQIQAGDSFTLTWYAQGLWNGTSGTYDGTGPDDAKQTVTFLSAATTGTAFGSTATLAAQANGVPGGAGWQPYTLAYNSIPADVGQYVGVSFITARNSGLGTGTWTGFDDFTLTLLPAGTKPVVAVPPTSQTAFLGSTVNFTVMAAGSGLHYQWQAGAVGSGVYTNLSNGGQFSGAITATLVITNLHLGNAADYVVVVSNTGGSVTSTPPATLTMDASLPTIDTPPTGQAVAQLSTTTLSVAATGGLTYQWQAGAVGSGVYTNITNGGQFSGATTPNLVITGFRAGNEADYVVVVSNGAGSVTSSPATLTFDPSYIANSSFEYPGTVKIKTGFDTPGSDVPGWMNTGGAYTDTGVQSGGNTGSWEGYTQTGEGGAYQITGYQIHAGDSFTLTWYARGEWNGSSSTYDGTGPNDAKQTVTFLSAASTTTPFGSTTAVAVQANGVPGTGGGIGWSPYTLTYNSVPADVGQYLGVSFITARNSGSGFGTWTAFDDFSLAVQAGGTPPVLVTSPANQTAFLGSTVMLTVAVSGSGLGYQWEAGAVGSGVYTNISNGGQFSGATAATLVITNLQLGNQADYLVVVTNRGGSVTSAPPATLTVNTSLPTIVTPPFSQGAAPGGVVTLSVTATGGVTYQWRARGIGGGVYTSLVNGGHFSGATTSQLVISNFQEGNLADYMVVVSNGAGAVNSPSATVTWNLIANSSFELPGTVKIKTGFDTAGNDVPNWMNCGGTYTDTGVQGGGHSGSWEGYDQTDEGGAYQITGYRIRAGDSFTLSWYAQGEWNGSGTAYDGTGPNDPQQTVTILNAASTSTDFATTATLAGQTNGVPGGAGWQRYSLTYQSVPADVGQYIGVSFITVRNSGSGTGTWTGFDDFSLILNGVPPPLTPAIHRSGTNLTVTLPYGTLLEATSVNGPWTTNINTSPYVITRTNSMMFFRGQLP